MSGFERADHTLWPGLTLILTLAGAWLLYSPGLSGVFLFDDWKNLEVLGEQGTIQTGQEIVTYLLSGFAGPTGRPLSLASFLLDANTWPAAAAVFKYTNVLIHLLNGALLTALLWQLAGWLGAPRARAAWIAVLGAALWLLHPLFVSTTLYVVQRMAMLAATFVLAGLVSYVHGRRLLDEGRLWRGLAWMSFAIGGCGLLAVLSKENGALLPLLVLAVEWLILRPREDDAPASAAWAVWRWLFLYLPSLAVFAYLASFLPGVLAGDTVVGRDYTLWQRLLTEGRIVIDYLGTLWLPRPYTGGLFNDDITLSTGLFSPWYTVFAFIALAALLAAAIGLRRKAPTVALAVAFFLAGHLLESTVVPLELYFEHRNYLPALLMGFPLAWYLVMANWPRPRLRLALALVAVALLAVQTGLRAELWGRPFGQALVWAQQNPQSPRALGYLAGFWRETGNTHEAIRLLNRALAAQPDDLASRLKLTLAKCRAGAVANADIEALRTALRKADGAGSVQRYQLKTVLSRLQGQRCGEWTPAVFRQLLDDAIDDAATTQAAIWRQMLLQLRGEVAARQGQPGAAYADLIAALRQRPSRPGILRNAATLAAAGYPRRALGLMDTAPRPAPPFEQGLSVGALREAWLVHTGYYAREMAHLREVIGGDLAARREGASAQERKSAAPIPREPSAL